jgi:hypothetical protein
VRWFTRLASSLTLATTLAVPFCHTVNPTRACFDSLPLGQTPSIIYEARQEIINGEQHYLCHGFLPVFGERCWGVRHWDHQIFGPTRLWCP